MRHVAVGVALIAAISTAVIGCGGAAGPSGSPLPSAGMSQVGKVVTVVQNGVDYAKKFAPEGSTVTDVGDSVELVSTMDAKLDASVEYDFDQSVLPPGSTIDRMDVAVCGAANGDFWELYGPDAEPYELEVTPPDADGCWHFTGADGSSDGVTAYVYQDTKLRLDRLIWTIALA